MTFAISQKNSAILIKILEAAMLDINVYIILVMVYVCGTIPIAKIAADHEQPEWL